MVLQGQAENGAEDGNAERSADLPRGDLCTRGLSAPLQRNIDEDDTGELGGGESDADAVHKEEGCHSPPG